MWCNMCYLEWVNYTCASIKEKLAHFKHFDTVADTRGLQWFQLKPPLKNIRPW